MSEVGARKEVIIYGQSKTFPFDGINEVRRAFYEQIQSLIERGADRHEGALKAIEASDLTDEEKVKSRRELFKKLAWLMMAPCTDPTTRILSQIASAQGVGYIHESTVDAAGLPFQEPNLEGGEFDPYFGDWITQITVETTTVLEGEENFN